MTSIIDLGLMPEQAIELLTHKAVSLAQADTGVLDGLFDASDRPEDGGVIVWFNNFETDKRYERWGSALSLVCIFALEIVCIAKTNVCQLLRPMYPGQLPTLKQNLFNVVVVADLSRSSTLNFIGGMMNNIIERGFGYRWGVVPILETDEGKP